MRPSLALGAALALHLLVILATAPKPRDAVHQAAALEESRPDGQKIETPHAAGTGELELVFVELGAAPLALEASEQPANEAGARARARTGNATGARRGAGARTGNGPGNGAGAEARSGARTGSGPGNEAGAEARSGAGAGPGLGTLAMRGPESTNARTAISGNKWRPTGDGGFEAKGEPYRATISPDGRIHFQDAPPVQFEGLGGRFDLTDSAMKALGQTLYPYRKHKLMEETREQRFTMAVEHKKMLRQKALERQPSELEELWRSPNYTTIEKRRLLFELWDECAEEGSDELVRGARVMRATIILFIRRRLPRGGPQEYGAEELVALNRGRQSRALFEPYADNSAQN